MSKSLERTTSSKEILARITRKSVKQYCIKLFKENLTLELSSNEKEASFEVYNGEIFFFVILSDSKAALKEIDSTRAPYSEAIKNCLKSIMKSKSCPNKTICLRWISPLWHRGLCNLWELMDLFGLLTFNTVLRSLPHLCGSDIGRLGTE
ncbi:hypothetical protein CEXT_263971 [Caerostris extrusa]|uniref:Uncharacterized protein n=1 Tax=Caerostris extrusa TaxID=172846 RepID=A0AAV4U096_CAEEX|nr:hypothetical protein CEXT_263971 [Caerostris extrusa]